MVMPTVYIGIGTSGTEIIQGVRRLIYEEYGQPGLPCVIFLSIETNANIANSGMDVYVQQDERPWERMQIVPITVNTQQLIQLRSKVDPSSPDYHPGWDEWIEKKVMMGSAFINGAQGWRMAGRFCLWANWDNVKDKIDNAIHLALGGRNETVEFLKKHYEKKLLPLPQGNLVEPRIRVYICGSLCGGTCSGTFWEIGYMVREALNTIAQAMNPEIYGTFTVVDKETSQRNNQSDILCSLNSWAALLEYDYWSSGEKPYQILHPANKNIDFPPQPNDFGPYHWLNIISPSNSGGANGGTYSGRRLDLSALHISISTALYLDLLPQVRSVKDQAHAQYRGTGQINNKSISGFYLQCLLSFGLSGFYYPKFMIATAAACRLSQKLVDHWIKDGDAQRIKQKALEDGNDIINEIQTKLSQFPSGKSKDQWLTMLNEDLDKYKDSDLPKLISYFQNEHIFSPNTIYEQKIIEALDGQNKLYQFLHEKVNDLSKEMIDLINHKVNDMINSAIGTQGYSLKEINLYIASLEEKIREEISGVRTIDTLPSLDFPSTLLKETQRRLNIVSKDFWLKILFAQKSIHQYYMERSIAEIHKLVKERVDQIILCVMREIFVEVYSQLHGDNIGGVYGEQTLRVKNTERIRLLADKVHTDLLARWEDIVRNRPQGNLRMVTFNASLEEDAKDLERVIDNSLNRDDIYDGLLVEGNRRRSFKDFIDQQHEQIENQLLQYFLPRCLQTTKSVKILDKFGTQMISNQVLLEVERSSYPFLQFIGDTIPARGCDAPDIVIGPIGSSKKLNSIINQLSQMDASLPLFSVVETPMDHMVVFFVEAPALSLEDWQLESHLDRLLNRGGLSNINVQSLYSNHYTHKGGALFYHPKLRHIIDKVELWAEVAKIYKEPLIEYKFLREDNGKLIYVYTTRSDYEDDIDLYSGTECVNFVQTDDGIPASDFIDRIKLAIRDISIETILDITNKKRNELNHDRDKQKRLKEIYEKVVKEVFPEVLTENISRKELNRVS